MKRARMHTVSAASVLIGSMFMFADRALGQSAQDIVDTYTLVSVSNVQGEKKTELYGPNPKGIMRLDARAATSLS